MHFRLHAMRKEVRSIASSLNADATILVLQKVVHPLHNLTSDALSLFDQKTIEFFWYDFKIVASEVKNKGQGVLVQATPNETLAIADVGSHNTHATRSQGVLIDWTEGPP